MLLEALHRIRANPIEHLGRPSLDRLKAFETGYTLSQAAQMRDYPCHREFSDWVARLYAPAREASGDVVQILRVAAGNEEAAFTLYFDHLASVLAAHPEVLANPILIEGPTGEAPLPVSGFLEVLNERPRMFLPKLNPGCLRAFLDGVRLACLEGGFYQCADLDGFEHWVRRKLGLKGMFRWEAAVLAEFGGSEEDAFVWSLSELREYRKALGTADPRNYRVERLPD